MLAGGTRRTSATAWRRRGSSASSRGCWTWRRASGPPTCPRAPPSPSPSPTSTRPIRTISRFASRELCTVLRIRDVYPGSDFFPSRILIKEFKYFNLRKWFISSRKYDPGCSSRIRTQTFYPSWIQGSKRHRIPDPDPQYWLCIRKSNSLTKSRQKSS